MNINEVSLKDYLKMTEAEQDAFYAKIVKTRYFKKSAEIPIYHNKKIIRKLKNDIQFKTHQPKPGRLTFITKLSKEGDYKGRTFFLCICDCGNWYITRSDAFNKTISSGGCYSCGCLNQESLNQNIYNKEVQEKRINNLKEYLKDKGLQVGDISNYWKITQVKIEEQENGQHRKYIKGICPYCKKESNWIRADGIQSGSVISCGCSTESRGEQEIRLLLEKANISYIQEKTFNNCINPDTQRPLRFDFFVNNKYLIEFDGKQHYGALIYNSTEKDYINLQKRDEYKNNWCKENNIPLIRIPYTSLGKIKIEDLIPETSKFIYKGE